MQKQTSGVKSLLKKIVSENQFNAYCVDCMKEESSFANITYGTFICRTCADWHKKNYTMADHYIKKIWGEAWDSH